MGFLSWIFPTARDRKAKARRLLEEDPGTARLVLDGLDDEEAQALRRSAEDGLVRLNLEQARLFAENGERQRAAEHVKLAEGFAGGRFGDELKEIRRAMRESRKASPSPKPKGESYDPMGLGGKPAARCSKGRGPVPPEAPAAGFGANDPIFSLPPGDPRVRHALLLESYPEALRSRFLALGKELAEAVLALDDGDPKRSWAALSDFVSREPAVRFERARAAMAMNRHAAAASDLRTFVDTFGHQTMGRVHTAVMLAQALSMDKRLQEALEVVVEARGEAPRDLELQASEVHILEGLGRLEEAESAGSDLLRRAPQDLGVHRIVGRLRMKMGRRVEAMQVLEGGLTRLCKGPGKCGSQPVDPEAARMLAQLYLEDGVELKRAEELLREVARAGAGGGWMDRYLDALRALRSGDKDMGPRAAALLAELSEGDGRRDLVARYLKSA